jgi:hypothetical protein
LVTSHPANCYNAFNKQLRWNRFELSELRWIFFLLVVYRYVLVLPLVVIVKL